MDIMYGEQVKRSDLLKIYTGCTYSIGKLSSIDTEKVELKEELRFHLNG